MQRNKAIDTVKGFAIVLVMIGHCIVLNGLNESDPYIYDAIKSVQMPLFMLVSGVLASYGVQKNGCGEGLKKLPQRCAAYLVPFFSWFVLVHFYTHGKAGTLSFSVFWKELKELLFQTDRGLWFLMTLFVATVCVMSAQLAADKLVPNRGKEKGDGTAVWKKAAAFLAVSLFLYALFFVQSRSGNTFLSPSLMLHYFPFYLMGYVVNGYGTVMLKKAGETPAGAQLFKRAESVLTVLFLLVFVFMVIRLDLTAPLDGIGTLAIQMAASFFGTVSVYLIVYRLAQRYQKKTEKPGFLSFVGIYTLEIYVLHFRFARLLGLAEKELNFYSPEGIGWIVLSFLLMSLLTAVSVIILQRIPVVSYLLFGKKHVKAFRGKSDPRA
nr:acyltransferase [Lachnospiraceae bacterium]